MNLLAITLDHNLTVGSPLLLTAALAVAAVFAVLYFTRGDGQNDDVDQNILDLAGNLKEQGLGALYGPLVALAKRQYKKAREMLSDMQRNDVEASSLLDKVLEVQVPKKLEDAKTRPALRALIDKGELARGAARKREDREDAD